MADLGYDADFLETPLAPPQAPDGDEEPDVDDVQLDYMHFTVRMYPARRLASWVAWNIDGLRVFPSDSISRSGETFRADPRIPITAQTLNDAYEDNRLDRGHIARRSDLLWGTLAEARTANSDSFFFTNITPQIDDFNQSGRGGSWGLLENAVLAQEGLTDRRLTLFAGPVLRDDDPTYRNVVQLPREHWKVVLYRMDGQLRFKRFVLSQDLDLIDERTFLDDFDTPTSCRWTSSKSAPGSRLRVCERTHRPPNYGSRTPRSWLRTPSTWTGRRGARYGNGGADRRPDRRFP